MTTDTDPRTLPPFTTWVERDGTRYAVGRHYTWGAAAEHAREVGGGWEGTYAQPATGPLPELPVATELTVRDLYELLHDLFSTDDPDVGERPVLLPDGSPATGASVSEDGTLVLAGE